MSDSMVMLHPGTPNQEGWIATHAERVDENHFRVFCHFQVAFAVVGVTSRAYGKKEMSMTVYKESVHAYFWAWCKENEK